MTTVVPEAMDLTMSRFVHPQEIADVIALLVSPGSVSTTGSDFAVDSGFLKATRRSTSCRRPQPVSGGDFPNGQTISGCVGISTLVP